jgi:hypothetical protein
MGFHERVARVAAFLMVVGLTTVLGCQRGPTPGPSQGATTAGSRFTWQYAGKGQLEIALAVARKDGKVLLVGLSGVAAD